MSANLRKYILYHDSCLKEICKIPPLADKMSIGVTDRLLLAMHESWILWMINGFFLFFNALKGKREKKREKKNIS